VVLNRYHSSQNLRRAGLASPPGVTMLSAHGMKVLAANLDIAGLAPAVVVCLLGAITILLTVMPPIPLIHCVFARTGTARQS
jgi:hypothetical protein